MFSMKQKREISAAVQPILRNTNHPELPAGEIQFLLHVDGAVSWSWADIRNNGAVTNPTQNPFNELNSGEPKVVRGKDAEIERLQAELAAERKKREALEAKLRTLVSGTRVEDELPPLGDVVVLEEDDGRIIIGWRADEPEGWLWGVAYGIDYNRKTGKWRYSDLEEDDMHPVRWWAMPGNTEATAREAGKEN